MFGVLEAQLGRHPQPQRVTVIGRQRLAAEIQRQNGLWMQCGGHIDAGIVTIRAFESDVTGVQIRPDVLQEIAQRHATPLANGTPALDAD
ncbi:hypothetical protein D3C80_1245010 [compost metagenome]